MRRGGALHPPRPRAPAATRQAPPFLPYEDQVFHTDSRDFKNQGFGEVHVLLRKEGTLWRKGERQQTLSWDQQNPKSCQKLEEPSLRQGQELKPQVRAMF